MPPPWPGRKEGIALPGACAAPRSRYSFPFPAMNQYTVIFLAAFVLAVLMFWYLATDNPLSKRWVGTVLSVGLCAFCLLGIVPVDRLGKVPAAIQGKVPWSEVHTLQAGIDIAGGSAFTLQLQPSEGKEINPLSVNKAMDVVRERLNALGNKDLSIAPRGREQIILQMPGVGEAERTSIRTQLEKAAKLDFHLVHPDFRALVPRMEAGEIVPGYQVKLLKHKDKKGAVTEEEKIVITKRADLAGTFVDNAGAQNDPNKGWVTIVGFTGAGRKQFGDLTGAHIGERLAIVLDGEVVSAPTIQVAITQGSAEISGMGTAEAAQDLANALNNPLENAMKIVEEQSVSATLGAEAVRQGVMAGALGFIATLVFLIFYYRIPGVIAFIGLCVNFAVLLGIMAMFQFSFTLPGIAGVILSIGMAVDSNVLIYERLKEELALGKSLGVAVEASFDKAFSAIFDANITTLLTGIVLYWRATDAVRGFAVTLICGILGTLFATLIVTRICFRWLIDTGFLKKINIGRPMTNRHIGFLGMARVAFITSLAMTVVSIGAAVVRGKDALSVDFRGGSLITFQLPEEKAPAVADVQAAVADAGLKAAATVQQLTLPGSAVAQIQIRSEEGSASKVVEHLRATVPAFGAKDAAGNFVASETTMTVGATMGKELMISSAWALALGLLAILVYLSVRFEFAFALAAVVALVHDLVITIGIMLLFGREMSAVLVGALLTVAGYSVNDTIVVFDRIRETLRSHGGDVRTIMNEAINETLSRTLLTSLTTLFTLVAMSVFGGAALRDFCLSLIIGIVVGTYSSIYVASSFVLWWAKLTGRSLRKEVIETEIRRGASQAAT